MDDRGQLQVIELSTTAIVLFTALNIALSSIIVDGGDNTEILKIRGHDVLECLYYEEIGGVSSYKDKYYDSKLVEYVCRNDSSGLSSAISTLLNNGTGNIKFDIYLLNSTMEYFWYRSTSKPAGETVSVIYDIPVKDDSDIYLKGDVMGIKLLMWW